MLPGIRARSANILPFFRSVQRYSSSIEAQANLAANYYYRCNEQNPLNHTLSHESQFYVIPTEEYKKLFGSAIGSMQKTVRRNIDTFNEFALMIRRPAVEVMHYLKSADYSAPAVRYVLYGKVGCGKSMSLIHLIHFASRNNWLVVHVPWVPMWVRMCKEWNPSQTRQGRVDQPTEASEWLKLFKSQNSELLSKLNLVTSQQYTWSQREVTEKDKPLMEIIDQGINRIKFASDCVAVLLKELKLNASAGRARVFVAIHGANALFGRTRLKHEDKSPVKADEVTLIHAFRKLIKNDWTNASIVTTISPLANHSEQREFHYPRYLLGKEGFESFDPFIPISVENYTTHEANSLLDYFIDARWIQTEGAASEQGKKELIFLSGKNPLKLSEVCNPW